MAERKDIEKRQRTDTAVRTEQPERYIRPRTSVYEQEDSITVMMDLPGVSKNNLDISFNKGELTVTGRRDTWNTDEMKACYCERFDGNYRRTFAIDNTLDASKIDAKLNKGVLELSIPKVEAVKPRKIEIKTS
jgi:HSP20 family protein